MVTNGSKYWSEHLAAIEAEGVTTKAHAEREGLAVGSLYAWRRRLKRGQPAQRRLQGGAGFVSVRIRLASEPMECALVVGAGMRLELSQLLNPAWLAALSAAVSERGR